MVQALHEFQGPLQFLVTALGHSGKWSLLVLPLQAKENFTIVNVMGSQ